jgi:hypothetical protein
VRRISSLLVLVSGLVAAAPSAFAVCSPANCKPMDSCHTAACVAGVCRQTAIPGCADGGPNGRPDAAPGTPDAGRGDAAPGTLDAGEDQLQPRRDLTGCACQVGRGGASPRAAIELAAALALWVAWRARAARRVRSRR